MFGVRNDYTAQAQKKLMQKKIDVQALENKTDKLPQSSTVQTGHIKWEIIFKFINLSPLILHYIKYNIVRILKITNTDCSCL